MRHLTHEQARQIERDEASAVMDDPSFDRSSDEKIKRAIEFAVGRALRRSGAVECSPK